MARILMTGMCSVQDRNAYHADERRVFFRPFPEPVRGHAEYIAQFQMAANTGNYLITEGAYRAFAGNEITYIPFWYLQARLSDPGYIAYISEEYHFCLFGTANILNSDFDLTNEVKVLETFNLPTVFMSIGVQRRSDLANALQPSASRFIEFLKRPTSFCFTRGVFAAEFLRSQGVKNVFEACCPSVFNYPTQIIAGIRRLKEIELKALGEIWVNGYLGDHQRTADDLTIFASYANRIGYVFQDEPLLFGATANLSDDPAIYDEATGRLTKAPACHVTTVKGEALDYYAFFSPEQWRIRSSTVDLLIGRRFHGNLVGLQAGRPAFYIAHDDRVTEMLQSVGLPFVTPQEWDAATDKPAMLEKFARGIDLAKFEDTYQGKHAAFREQIKTIWGQIVDPAKP